MSKVNDESSNSYDSLYSESQNRKLEIKRRNFLLTAIMGGIGLSTNAKAKHQVSAKENLNSSDDDLNQKVSEGLNHPAHPFWPAPRLTILTDHKMHRSRGSGLVILKDKWLFFWREASIHGASDPESLVKMGESRNGGQTIENVQTIYEEIKGITGTDIRARLMANGRIGIFGSRRDSSDRIKGITLKPFFIYSDDEGKSWTSQILENFSCAMSPSFTFSRYPSSVGGHDDKGYILFCHGNGMNAAYTIDNGETWKDKKVFESIGGEVSVVRLGDTNRWIMTCRSGNSMAPVYKSTDLLNWEGPYNSGKKIGHNPSTIVYNNGYITWIAASRPYHFENDESRAIPVNGEMFKGIVSCTIEDEEIWKNPSQWPDWSILMYMPIHFDGTFVKNNGFWYMLFGAIEDPLQIASPGRKKYSQLGLMRSELAPGPIFNGFKPGWIYDRKYL